MRLLWGGGPEVGVLRHWSLRAKDLSTPNFDFDNFGLDIGILYVYYTALWIDCRHYAFLFFSFSTAMGLVLQN